MENSLKPKSLTEHIVEDLEDKIISGDLKPGERIIEEELCKNYGVSRSPVREAFRILESQGFVTRKPRKGISVAEMTPKEMDDVYRIIAYLESLAVYQAVEKKNPKVIAKLKKLHEQMKALAAQKKIKAYFKVNLKFHEILIKASENSRLIQILETFTKQTQQYRFRFLSAPGRMAASQNSHEAIIRALETGDAAYAENMRKRTILKNVRLLNESIRADENNST